MEWDWEGAAGAAQTKAVEGAKEVGVGELSSDIYAVVCLSQSSYSCCAHVVRTFSRSWCSRSI